MFPNPLPSGINWLTPTPFTDRIFPVSYLLKSVRLVFFFQLRMYFPKGEIKFPWWTCAPEQRTFISTKRTSEPNIWTGKAALIPIASSSIWSTQSPKANVKRLCFYFSTLPRLPSTGARVGDTMAGAKGSETLQDVYMVSHTGEGQLFRPQQLIVVTCSFLKRNCKFKFNVITNPLVLCQKMWWFLFDVLTNYHLAA